MKITKKMALRYNLFLAVTGFVLLAGGTLLASRSAPMPVTWPQSVAVSGGMGLLILSLAWSGAMAIGSCFRFNAERMVTVAFVASNAFLAMYLLSVAGIVFRGQDIWAPPNSNWFFLLGTEMALSSSAMFFLLGVRKPVGEPVPVR